MKVYVAGVLCISECISAVLRGVEFESGGNWKGVSRSYPIIFIFI